MEIRDLGGVRLYLISIISIDQCKQEVHYQTLVGKKADSAVLLGQYARLRLSAQCFDCIIEKRRGKLRHKKIISEILVVYDTSHNF